MALNITLKKLVHRKSVEYMNGLRTATGTGAFIVSDKSDIIPKHDCVYYVGGVSAVYNYNADEDSILQIPNSGAAGTFGAGSCGEFNPLSMLLGNMKNTASAGTTTTITTTATIIRDLEGCEIRVVGGTGIGYQGTIKRNTKGANAIITLNEASSVAFDATTQYQIYAGSLWFFNAGTTAVGFSVYDRATNLWYAKSVAGLPVAWGTDAQLVSTSGKASNYGVVITKSAVLSATSTTMTLAIASSLNTYKNYKFRVIGGTGNGQVGYIDSNTSATNTVVTLKTALPIALDATSVIQIEGNGFVNATATGGTTTTLTTGKTMPLNGWANNQVRIISGTGAGQISQIASNTTTGVLTLTTAFAIAPDTTSVYVIESDDNSIYLAGNNSVTMYKYNISTNAWVTLAPTVARSGNYISGGTLDYIDSVPGWSNELYTQHYLNGATSVLSQNGRYLYSFRGNSVVLDVYDIALNTWHNNILYGNQLEAISTGACAIDINGLIYIQQGNALIHRFDVDKNTLEPVAFNPIPQSTVVPGDKLFIQTYKEGDKTITYLYALSHSRAEIIRLLLI